MLSAGAWHCTRWSDVVGGGRVLPELHGGREHGGEFLQPGGGAHVQGE